jgi:anti-sigma factor RsiW
MWRRLLWQLLGKLSPEAQAFYAQYTAACPHCPDPMYVWQALQVILI